MPCRTLITVATRSCTRAKAGRVSVRWLRQDLLPFFPETVLIHEFQTQIVDALEQAIPRKQTHKHTNTQTNKQTASGPTGPALRWSGTGRGWVCSTTAKSRT